MSAAPFEFLYQEELYTIPAGVVVVIDRDWNAVPEEEKTLLTKILGSVKLGPAKVRIIARDALSVASLEQLSPAKILIFGAKLENPVEPYQLHTIAGNMIIVAQSLGQLDDARKKNLWQALRQMFGI